MLMIGSLGRNSGKTKFGCALISRLSSHWNITAVKVSTIRQIGAVCPRGRSGCNVCSSLEGFYQISEQTGTAGHKDTSRMLAAGARRVFWLRVIESHLQEGIEALLDITGASGLLICESNSLRKVVEPGLFIMFKRNGSEGCKPSAAAVAEHADRIISFCGDIGPDEIGVTDDGEWSCRLKATAIILAGGASSRMGTDKAMLMVEGQPVVKRLAGRLMQNFEQVIISANDRDRFAFLGLQIVQDELPDHGPLGGIVSGLKASANDVNFIVACDIPEIDMSFVRAIIRKCRDYDAVVPRQSPGQYEPLFAVYRKSSLAGLEAALDSGKNRITDALSSSRVKYIQLDSSFTLTNLNTVEDYLKFTGKKTDAAI